MQKKIIALAVAGLSTAAIAQTNVTIYGVADVSAQGDSVSQAKATASKPSGNAFNLKSNSSLIGAKGTEALGNGLNALFQMEYNVGMTGASSGAASTNSTVGDAQWGLRDTFVGVNSKYGTVLGGYLSTPFRSTLTSFDVMPGATGDGRIESLMGKVGFAGTVANGAVSYTGSANSSVRATAIAYAMPTLYGFNGSIAFTGQNNNGNSNQTTATGTVSSTGTAVTAVTANALSALSMNLGWTGYGVNVAGAFQQAKLNVSTPGIAVATSSSAIAYYPAAPTALQGLTSYLVGASYTGMPGLKVSAVYNRNTLGTNAMADAGAQKGSNNSVYIGASYRFGNNEPRLSWQHQSNTSGLAGVSQNGAGQWTANWGYYLSKRTQVYGIVSAINNAAGAANNFASGNTVTPVAGNNLLTYGAGLRTNF